MGRKRDKAFSPVMLRVFEACGIAGRVPPDRYLTELAAYLGRPLNTVRNWDKRETGIPIGELIRVSERTKRPLEWLTGANGPLSGPYPPGVASTHYPHHSAEIAVTVLRTAEANPLADEPFAATTGKYGSVALLVKHGADESQYQVIPRYALRVSAGAGLGHADDEKIGEFAFEMNWMRRNLGRSGHGFASVVVHGDSMQPTLLNGDEIIIDKQVARVDVNGIYVIAIRGDLLVKRVQRMLDGSLVIRSDNSAYAPETVSADGAEDFRVVGRMVWPRVR